MGAAVLLLVTDRDVPARLADRGAQGMQGALAGLVRELNLEGAGVLVPGHTADEPSRLFVSASPEQGDVPDAKAGAVTVHRQGPTAIGLTLPPPGAGLEAEWRDTHGLPQGRGMEEAALHLRTAFPALGLGRQLSFARAGGRVRVAYTPDAFADACKDAREHDAPWHEQGGCPACSFAAILLARAMRANVRLRATGGTDGRVELDLEVLA